MLYGVHSQSPPCCGISCALCTLLAHAYPPLPARTHRFHTYDSTVTHGFGPIKMTLDLYKPDNTTATEEAASCSL